MRAIPFSPGTRYGKLTLLNVKRIAGKPLRYAFCVCDCGASHIATFQDVRLGKSVSCRKCSSWRLYGTFEKLVRDRFQTYKVNARNRSLPFLLSIDEFRELFSGTCVYCGESPAKGVDRRDNQFGYFLENCSPCCKSCNLAKLDRDEIEFLEWVRKVSIFQGFVK